MGYSPQWLYLPKGAKPLHFGEHNGELCLWVEVEHSGQFESRVFEMFAMGYEIPQGATHIGSVQHNGYVWHLYEIPNSAV